MMTRTVTQPRAVTYAAYRTSADLEDLITDLMQAIGRRSGVICGPDGSLAVTLADNSTSLSLANRNCREEAERLRRTVFTFGPQRCGCIVRMVLRDHGRQKTTFVLEPWCTEILTDTTQGVTTYRRQTVLSFRHKYTKRLYRIACDTLGTGGLTTDREALIRMLGIPKKDSIQRLKKVLATACEDIARSDAGFTLAFSETAQKIHLTATATAAGKAAEPQKTETKERKPWTNQKKDAASAAE